MKRILTAITTAALVLLMAPNAIAATTITANASSVVSGTSVTVTVDGPVTLTEKGLNWDPTGLYGGRITGDCTGSTSGSWQSGGQVLTVVCTGSGTLTAQASQTFTLLGSDGQALTVTVTPAVVVTPPPAPVAHITTSYVLTPTTYTVTLLNDGTATYTGGYADPYQQPRANPDGTPAVVAPAGVTVSWRTQRVRNRTVRVRGFAASAFTVPVGGSVTFVVTL